MGERIALFIDGAYLEKITKTFSNKKIDHSKLVSRMTEDRSLIRCYYYDCLPYKSSPPKDDENTRFSQKEKFFKRLRHLDNFTVRLGKLAFRGVSQNGKEIFEQKRVDVYLATDLVLYSTKHLITHAGLLAGDSDYLPAIEISQSEGVVVTLFYTQERSVGTHNELIEAVDRRVIIDEKFLDQIA